jgi:hypothetical protein
MNLVQRSFIIAALFALAAPTFAHAALLSTEASDNATVQVAGPRAGANGKNFFNVEGSLNGNFASYGVADFQYGALANTVIGITAATLHLTQSNAAFSTTGPIVLSLDKKAALSDIQPGTSPLAFDGVDPGTGADVGAGDLDLLAIGGGPFVYSVNASGFVDNYVLVLDAATKAEIISRLNSAATIRLVVGTGANNLAATWAGFSNTTSAGPTLDLEVEYDTGTPAATSTWGRVKASYR